MNKIDFTNIGVKFRSKLRGISLLIYSRWDSSLSPILTCRAHLVLFDIFWFWVLHIQLKSKYKWNSTQATIDFSNQVLLYSNCLNIFKPMFLVVFYSIKYMRTSALESCSSQWGLSFSFSKSKDQFPESIRCQDRSVDS